VTADFSHGEKKIGNQLLIGQPNGERCVSLDRLAVEVVSAWYRCPSRHVQPAWVVAAQLSARDSVQLIGHWRALSVDDRHNATVAGLAITPRIA
jgi:hypothetical protein